MTRCAIYTRKSHEEGLGQDFNSLDAQRDAALSYIQSQKHEGWKVVKTEYNDGGYSGGHLNRPALQKLITDIKARKIDIIVVYKIDRLTRSLTDFAKLIDIFDEYNVTFVSVTQSFNTTTSMGRLTLNVLLSFAQFEREITGERIRDKISSSMQKGIWMGGMIPLGYDVQNRELLINEKEAEIVRYIFSEYLNNLSIFELLNKLQNKGITNKSWVTQKGHLRQGKAFSRSSIYTLLHNPIYIGKLKHKDGLYDGNHQAIINLDLWERVQEKLKRNYNVKVNQSADTDYMLKGKLYNPNNQLYETTYSLKRLSNGVRKTRYYVLRGHKTSFSGEPIRLNADKIESAVIYFISALLYKKTKRVVENDALSEFSKDALKRVEISKDTLSLSLHKPFYDAFISDVIVNRINTTPQKSVHIMFKDFEIAEKGDEIYLCAFMEYKNYAGQFYVTDQKGRAVLVDSSSKNQNLIQALVCSSNGYRALQSGQCHSIKALAEYLNCDRSYMSKILKCAFLSPKIKEAILDGRQPANMTVQKLIKISEHALWDVQERKFGIHA